MIVANLKTMIEDEAGGDPIEAAVIGVHYNDENKYTDDPPARHPDKLNRVLSWEEAAPILDEEYNNSYGGADCWPVTAWTANRVIYVTEYDGATGVTSVPRHPIDHEPRFS